MSLLYQQEDEDPGLNRALEAWSREAGERPLTMVVVGKSGAGKSTLINNFLELEKDEMCPTGNGASVTTLEVVVKENVKKDVTVRMIDTPGLGGIDEIRAKDVFKDLSKITNHKADVIVYCISSHPSSCIDSTDIDIIRAITSAFGPEIWRHTILALTFAGRPNTSEISSSEYQARICNYASAFQDALRKANVRKVLVKSALSEEVPPQSIPAVPIEGAAMENSLNDDSCSQWTNTLFTEALKKSNPKAVRTKLKLSDRSSEPVVRMAELGGSVAAGTAVGAAIGTAIGAPFLGIGIIVGVTVGAVVGGAVGSLIPTVIKVCKQHS
jgi:energy-coupling factor transporter ATP-binding protein EcfA2